MLEKCVGYPLETIGQTPVAKELKRIYLGLFLSEMVDYSILAGLPKNIKLRSKLQQKSEEGW